MRRVSFGWDMQAGVDTGALGVGVRLLRQQRWGQQGWELNGSANTYE